MENKIYKYEGSNDRLFDKVNCDEFDATTKFIVPETHKCLYIVDGVCSQVYTAGKYDMFEYKKGLIGKAKKLNDSVELVFMSNNARMEIHWGTQDLVDAVDKRNNIQYKMGARGTIEVSVTNLKKFYLELVHTYNTYDAADLEERLREYIVQKSLPRILRYFRDNELDYYDFMYNLEDITENIRPIINDMLTDEYGLEVKNMTLNIYIPEDDKQRLNAAYGINM